MFIMADVGLLDSGLLRTAKNNIIQYLAKTSIRVSYL